MVIFEDFHWIDEATQELLNLLADSNGTAKILLLVNYRPEYSHSWGSKTYYTQLRLDPLGKESAGEMLSALGAEARDSRRRRGDGRGRHGDDSARAPATCRSNVRHVPIIFDLYDETVSHRELRSTLRDLLADRRS
jgi:hypothetical protein